MTLRTPRLLNLSGCPSQYADTVKTVGVGHYSPSEEQVSMQHLLESELKAHRLTSP